MYTGIAIVLLPASFPCRVAAQQRPLTVADVVQQSLTKYPAVRSSLEQAGQLMIGMDVSGAMIDRLLEKSEGQSQSI